MREILSDLVAEEQHLDQFLQRIPIRDWNKSSAAPGWSIRDVLSHLAASEELAADIIAGGTRIDEIRGMPIDDWNKIGIKAGRTMRPQDVIEWWRGGRAKVVEPLSDMDHTDRIQWLNGDMSARTFATYRLMETWAHGLDIEGVVEIPVTDDEDDVPPDWDTSRLRHVCFLGWKTLPSVFEEAGIEYTPIRVEVMGPAYAKWVYGPEDSDQLIRGSASEFARLSVRRLEPGATNLKVTGDVAEQATKIVRAFL